MVDVGFAQGNRIRKRHLQPPCLNNSKEQFSNSPDLATDLMNAIIDAFEAHGAIQAHLVGAGEVV